MVFDETWAGTTGRFLLEGLARHMHGGGVSVDGAGRGPAPHRMRAYASIIPHTRADINQCCVLPPDFQPLYNHGLHEP